MSTILLDDNGIKILAGGTVGPQGEQGAQGVPGVAFKTAVATFADLATTYPSPDSGWVAGVNDEFSIYHYNGSAWEKVFDFSDSDTLNGQNSTYYLDYDNFTNTPSLLWQYGTLAEAVASTDISVGNRVRVLGRLSANDGGGNDYEVVSAATGSVDGGSFIDCAVGQLKGLFPGGKVNVLQFGAFDDPVAFTDPVNATEQQAYFDNASEYTEKEIFVPRGSYKISGPTSGKAHWILEPGVNIVGLGATRIGSIWRTDNLSGSVQHWGNRAVGGFGSPYEAGGCYKFGSNEAYEDDVLGHGVGAAVAGIGRNGGMGLLSAARSSQNTHVSGTTVMQTALTSLGLHDNTVNTSNVLTGVYSEVTRMPGTGSAFACEFTCKNFGANSVDVTALAPPSQSQGAAVGIQMITGVGPSSGSGSVDTTGFPTADPTPGTYGIGFIGDAGPSSTAPGWNKGIIVFKGSIAGSGNVAMEMYSDYGITWRADGGAVESQLYNNSQRMSYGDNTAANSFEEVFWRYRGTPNSRAQTVSGDVLGRTSYHGHKDSVFGFSQATNKVADVYVTQDSSVDGSGNAAGIYKIHVSNSSGGYYGLEVTSSAWRPVGDGVMDCGTAAARLNTVYATQGTINTSDERLKEQVRDITQSERNAALKIKHAIKAFKFKDAVERKSDKARWHFGVIAQQVRDIFTSEGLDAEQYGLFCYDEWDEERDENGNIIQEAGNRYGIRYDELSMFILGAL